MKKYMMATKAIHKMGDISRDEEDLAYIFDEDEDNWIGEWYTGIGFINVKFPKETTRPLTDEERACYESQFVQMGNSNVTPIRLDEED